MLSARISTGRLPRLFLPEIFLIGVLWGNCVTALAAQHSHAHSFEPPEISDAARIDGLIARMSFAEKIAVIRGCQEPAATDQGEAGYLCGVPRLGIPPMRFADGPPGILTREPSVAPTATMGLAATFSRRDARANGVAIGLEARRLGIDVALEPFINIMRDISFDRGWNTFGEDPLLTGTIGAAEIDGIQSEAVMAQAKHFVGYDMNGYDVTVGSQALHEIYLAPFADAVNAGVASIMCSYNRLNGVYACGNSQLLEHILRREMGFKGFVTSDWGATHSADYINAGLDMEMPGLMPPGSPWLTLMQSYFDDSSGNIPPLKTSLSVVNWVDDRSMPEETSQATAIVPHTSIATLVRGQFPDDPHPHDLWFALQHRRVSMMTVNRAVFRVLHEMDRFGYLGGKPREPTDAAPDPRIAGIVLKTSRDAAVLLKDDDQALPLKPSDYSDLALIGPGAGQVVADGIHTEHGLGIVKDQHGVFEILRDRTTDSDVRIRYAVADDMTGVSIPASQWSFKGEPGLVRLSEDRKVRRDAVLDFTRRAGTALQSGSFPTWKGDLKIPVAGIYGIYLQVLGANATLSIDGKIISHTTSLIGARHGDIVQPAQDNLLPTTDGLDNVRRDVWLRPGNHLIVLTTSDDTSHEPVQVRLSWVTPEARRRDFQQAVTLGAHARKVVIFAWARGTPVFGLPDRQNVLIDAISAVNPNTVVVLNTSLPVAMPWLSKVKAVLEMWWPGDEGGEATADVLQGRVSPAGRLPFTWARRLQDYPATDPQYPERGVSSSGRVVYSEGIFVGYRWFDKQGISPLYPFGYGLSYTSFAYSDLNVSRATDGGLRVAFKIRNVGRVPSDDVPQVYLGAPMQPPGDAQFAVRALAGFDRVYLRPGVTRFVTIHVPSRSLQYWSARGNSWATVLGTRYICVGQSAGDLRLKRLVRIDRLAPLIGRRPAPGRTPSVR